jgi:hypothetical protein
LGGNPCSIAGGGKGCGIILDGNPCSIAGGGNGCITLGSNNCITLGGNRSCIAFGGSVRSGIRHIFYRHGPRDPVTRRARVQ